MAEETPAVRRYFDGGGLGVPRMEPMLVERLLRYPYRLHTRELERLLALSLTTSDGQYLALTPEVERELDVAGPESDVPEEGERERLERVLAECGGRVAVAAERLGMSRQRMYRQLAKHGTETR